MVGKPTLLLVDRAIECRKFSTVSIEIVKFISVSFINSPQR